jgi:bacillithiol biosynthesis cysteine-adding enzyme BshC
MIQPEACALLKTENYPISLAPGLSRLFLDHCAAEPSLQRFYPWMSSPTAGPVWQQRPAVPAHWPELVRLLQEQNSASSAQSSLDSLAKGAGVMVTGQQVGLFGGPLFTPFKAATAVARARQATAAGSPHVPIFWLATEDHDFPEIDHVVFPARRELRKLQYNGAPAALRPVGGVVLDESVSALLDEAWELLGTSDAMDALVTAYKPGRTFAQAFADFYQRAFAAQGLLVLDAGSRAFHKMGAPVLRAGLEQADELHAALLERNRELAEAGYHAQVAVGTQSSLLFLIDEHSAARLALKRTPPTAAEPEGLWQAGRRTFSTAELVGILDAEPERISPSALLRPVFQDYLLSTSATIGGPAEIAYFAQSAVLFERILGRVTPSLARFSATLIEPGIAELLAKHELTLERVIAEGRCTSLAKLLAARSMPVEAKKLLASAGNALDAELNPLLEWMQTVDAGLGRSAQTSASKMRYQMNRLRNLAANFELQKEASLTRQAESICQSIFPDGGLQERAHGAAFYLAKYGFELNEELVKLAEQAEVGHTAVWL